jgi:hypothetical protein
MVFAAAFPAHAEDGEAFTISSTELDGKAAAGQGMVNALKQRAVAAYLLKILGRSAYERIAPQITSEFAETYILDYQVGRAKSGIRGAIELSGHLDGEQLRQWARLAETRQSGGNLKPLFLLSSAVTGLDWNPRNTGSKTREQRSAMEIFQGFQNAFTKLGIRATALDLSGLALDTPPRAPSELTQLSEAGQAAGYNGALWVHVMACSDCIGTRVEYRFYNFSQSRATIVDVKDVAVEEASYADATRVKKGYAALFDTFAEKLKEVVSRGTLQSGSHRLVVENLASPRAYKAADEGMQKLDFVTQSTLKYASSNTAEFELLSALTTEELSQRLLLVNIPGCNLKPTRIEGTTIVAQCGR